MNLIYSISQWLLTLFFGPLLAGLYNVVLGVSFWGPWGGGVVYFVILLVSVLFSMPALLIHLFFNWLFFTNHFNVLFTRVALIALSVMLILVALVGFMEFDINDSLVIGYVLAAVVSGAVLSVVANDMKPENEESGLS
jgi:hypothetical protein